jgi:uncharacterized protein YceH (UPF0502 family)
MDVPLDAVAVRVLGSLMEKQVTTPDNYPLTLNALVTACNQTSNRDPVMRLEEDVVAQSLKELMERSLVRQVHRSDSRAKRYRHLMEESLHLHPPEVAVLCVLLLRGAQTAGEIRTRTSRLFDFPDLARVGVTLDSLVSLERPLVVELPLRPGQKEVRYDHLLGGQPEPDPDEPVFDPRVEADPVEADRVEVLEATVESIRTALEELRREFDDFKRQFQ